MNTVMQEQKRKILIEELTTKGVYVTIHGNRVKDADYDELKQELVLQAFREIDVECESNKWF